MRCKNRHIVSDSGFIRIFVMQPDTSDLSHDLSIVNAAYTSQKNYIKLYAIEEAR